MGVLSDVATRLKSTEVLHPVAAAQHNAEKETKGWDRILPTAQRVILAAIATNGTLIPNSPPSTLQRFLNARNTSDLQAECALIYAGHNIYLPTSFFQSPLQGHILVIADPDTPTGLLPLLTPPSSTGPANARQRAMRIQVLLLVGQDRLPKEESGELLD